MDPVSVTSGPVTPPSSDLQFVAQVLLLVREGQQIPDADVTRLESIALHGHSTVLPSGVRAVTPLGGGGIR